MTDTPATMDSFTYTSQAQRVVFGPGSLARLPAELDALTLRRALMLCTPAQRGQAEQVAALLGPERVAGVFDEAVMHVPMEVVHRARAQARQQQADCAVAVGGGSTIGLGKAIALETGLPVIAVPTTYAGSEMTPIYGVTEAGLKRTGRDVRVLPRTVIYDPELSYDLPPGISLTSGINAIAHAAEGLYAQDRNPIMDLMRRRAFVRWRSPCRAWPTRTRRRPRAPTRCTVPGYAARCWVTWAWRCITSSVTPWEVVSICRMPRFTR